MHTHVRRTAALLLMVSALVAAFLVPASAAGGAATIVSVAPTSIWPNPDDRMPVAERSTVLTYTIDHPGDYSLHVVKGGLIHTTRHLGEVGVSAEPQTWRWNGRDNAGDVVERGEYRLKVVENLGPDTFTVVATSEPVTVHNGTQTLVVRDRRRERGTGVADLTWFTIVNGPHRVQLVWDFRRRVRPAFSGAYAGLDVNQARRGYYIGVRRHRDGLRLRFGLTLIGTEDRLRRIRCPRSEATLAPKRLTVTIPRNCMRVGGTRLRAFYGASARGDRHFDYGPDNGQYWTAWTAVESRP